MDADLLKLAENRLKEYDFQKKSRTVWMRNGDGAQVTILLIEQNFWLIRVVVKEWELELSHKERDLTLKHLGITLRKLMRCVALFKSPEPYGS